MRFWRSLLLPAVLLGAAAAPASAQTTPPVDKPVAVAPAKPALPAKTKTSKPERRAWMVGTSYGLGGTRFVGTWVPVLGELRSDTAVEDPPLIVGYHSWHGTDFESAKSFQYRLGYALNPRWTVGFERLQWFKDFGDHSWHFSTSTVSATWYPGAAHLFLRGGAGVSALAEKTPAIAPLFIESADQGVSVEGAVGYERVVYGRVAIAPEISIRQMNFGENIRAQIGSATVGLNWWF